jgi:hypothetical protein
VHERSQTTAVAAEYGVAVTDPTLEQAPGHPLDQLRVDQPAPLQHGQRGETGPG